MPGIAGTASAIFYNMGQCRTAGSGLFAHKKVFDLVVEGLTAETAKLKIGHGLGPETTMGPLVSSD